MKAGETDYQRLTVCTVSAGYCRVNISNPPINMLDGPLFSELKDVLERAEADAGLKVIVFESANSEQFISHLDVRTLSNSGDAAKVNLQEEWPLFIARLARSRIVSIAKCRGRSRGVGNEFILGCDMRFASAERSLFAQPEVGFGVVPGGGGLDWLPRTVGRSRALEIALGCTDYDATTAEKYGWINRAIPDEQLDLWVEDLAKRIASFDTDALATAKTVINSRVSVTSAEELRESFEAISRLAKTASATERMAKVAAQGWGSDTDGERWQTDLLSPYGASQSLRDCYVNENAKRSLLGKALGAQGGATVWRGMEKLVVRAHISGELWQRRDQQDALTDATLEIDPHSQSVVFQNFKGSGNRGVFTNSAVRIESSTGEVLRERHDPAKALAGQQKDTPWDDLSLIYNAGFDLWTYFLGAYILTWPGVTIAEAPSIEQAGERWTCLTATFPETLVTHARQQLYAINSSGQIRRFSYTPSNAGVPGNVNYASEFRRFDGIVLPTRRRMLPTDMSGRTLDSPVLMSIDVISAVAV